MLLLLVAQFETFIFIVVVVVVKSLTEKKLSDC